MQAQRRLCLNIISSTYSNVELNSKGIIVGYYAADKKKRNTLYCNVHLEQL